MFRKPPIEPSSTKPPIEVDVLSQSTVLDNSDWSRQVSTDKNVWMMMLLDREHRFAHSLTLYCFEHMR